MAAPSPPTTPTPVTPTPAAGKPLDYFAAFLSYLLPGLGQVIQGRIAKGILFFVCLNALFFYGLWMGKLKNVWLPDTSTMADVRLPLVGEVGGVVKSVYYRPQFLGQFWMGIVAWPAVIQYTLALPPEGNEGVRPNKLLGRYMQAPSEAEINELQRTGDKRFDLGWVYTVIAGALNILVIYDAFAGPVIKDEAEGDKPDPSKQSTKPKPQANPSGGTT